MRFIGRLLNEHSSGMSDHSAAIWALLMFESFLDNVHSKSFFDEGTARKMLGRSTQIDQDVPLSAASR
jgi:hypothetical protein